MSATTPQFSFYVIARSAATRQSMVEQAQQLDCHASLAMTKKLDCHASLAMTNER
jgi:hypothetical protein